MRKTTLMIIVLVCGLLFSACGGSNRTNTGEVESFRGNLRSLLNSGKPMKCSWEVLEEGVITKGMVYVDGQKTKSEVSVIQDGTTNEVHSLVDSEWVYTWGMMPGQGTKFRVVDEEGEMDFDTGEGFEGEATYKNMDEEYDYKCEGWRVDSSVFELPKDIEFVDWSETGKQIEQQVDNWKMDLTSMCNNLPEPQKSECMEGLGD